MSAFLHTLPQREIQTLAGLNQVINEVFFPIDLQQADGAPFRARVKRLELGPINVFGAWVSAAIMGVRHHRHIQDANADHCLIYLPLRMNGGERSWHWQEGKAANGGERIMTLIDAGREYKLFRPGAFYGLTLIVPHALLRRRLPRLENYCIMPHDASGGPFAVVWDLLVSLWYNQDKLLQSHKAGYAETIADLLALALQANSAQIAFNETATQTAYLRRAMDYIDQHLCDPALGPDAIAAALGISKRYLHELFQDTEQSIGAWIREKRLQHCRLTLTSSDMQGLSIMEVAYRWGFTSYAHFSRVFKEKYDRSPRQYRKDALRDESAAVVWRLEDEISRGQIS